MSNYQLITEGFQTLRSSLAPFIARELIKAYGDDCWWHTGVWERLYDYQRRNIPETGTYGELVDSLDVANSLLLIDINWRDVFKNSLTSGCLTWIKELRQARNNWAHFGGQQPTSRDTWRVLDTMSRLCNEIDHDAAEEIEALIKEIDFGELIASYGNEHSSHEEPSSQVITVEMEPVVTTKRQPRKFMTKREWTQAALNNAVTEWCIANGRKTLSGFAEMGYPAVAEAVLAMPQPSDGEDNSFCGAPDNTIFQINDAKMMAITFDEAAADREGLLEDAKQVSVATDVAAGNPSAFNQVQREASEQFEYLPKQKMVWNKEEILQLVDDWAIKHARLLSDQASRWRLDTLADMVLSKFPEQNDAATGFKNALPETLFAPDTRKMFILTHR